MIYTLPDDFTPDDIFFLDFSGRMSLIDKSPNMIVTTWTSKTVEITLTWDFNLNLLEAPDDTPQNILDAIQPILDAWPPGAPEWKPIYDRIKALALSAVGVDLDELTNAQTKALLAVLLHEHRAFAVDGTIRPLAEWVNRRL